MNILNNVDDPMAIINYYIHCIVNTNMSTIFKRVLYYCDII